eukprot:s521_g5.t1
MSTHVSDVSPSTLAAGHEAADALTTAAAKASPMLQLAIKAGKFPMTSVYQFGSDEALHAAPLPPKPSRGAFPPEKPNRQPREVPASVMAAAASLDIFGIGSHLGKRCFFGLKTRLNASPPKGTRKDLAAECSWSVMAAMMRERSRTPGPTGRKPEEWFCLQCSEHNFSRNEMCRKCQTPASQGVPLSELPIENFLTGYPVEEKVLEQLKTLPREQQVLVMKVGTLKGANDVNAVLIKRMANAKNGIISGYGSGPKGVGKGGWSGDMSTMMAMMASMANDPWSNSGMAGCGGCGWEDPSGAWGGDAWGGGGGWGKGMAGAWKGGKGGDWGGEWGADWSMAYSKGKGKY